MVPSSIRNLPHEFNQRTPDECLLDSTWLLTIQRSDSFFDPVQTQHVQPPHGPSSGAMPNGGRPNFGHISMGSRHHWASPSLTMCACSGSAISLKERLLSLKERCRSKSGCRSKSRRGNKELRFGPKAYRNRMCLMCTHAIEYVQVWVYTYTSTHASLEIHRRYSRCACTHCQGSSSLHVDLNTVIDTCRNTCI